jgi:serine/threonine protein kinase
MKPEERVGAWTLKECIGAGGNGEVWMAEDRAEVKIALKILKTRKQGGEPFARFRSEVEVNRRLSGRTGVLPLLDAHVPDETTPKDYAWMAMPIAQPIRSALGTHPSLRAVVEALPTSVPFLPASRWMASHIATLNQTICSDSTTRG